MKFGVHVSTSSKIYKAVSRAVELNCETLQIFTTNPRQWKSTNYPEKDLEEFNTRRAKSVIESLFCHSIYLLNLASPIESVYQNSINSLISSLVLAGKLNAEGVVTHIGSHLGAGPKEGISRISSALDYALFKTKAEVPIILENSAGGGSEIGGDLGQIRKIIDRVLKKNRIKICLDTAHVFEYGYDIVKKLDAFLLYFDKIIGLERLILLHLNDSRSAFGSHHDVHENIGEGRIGIKAFERLINHKKLNHLPAILETPHFKDKKADRKNLDKVRKLAKQI